MGNNFVSKSSNESINDNGIFVIHSYNENEVVPDASVSLVPPSKLSSEIIDFNCSDQTTKTTPGDNKYTTKLFRIPIDANNPKKQFLIKIDTKEGKMFSSKITYDRERINFLFQRAIIPKQEMSMLPVKFKLLKRWEEFRLYFKFLKDNEANEDQMKYLFKDSILEIERMIKPKDISKSTVQSTIDNNSNVSTTVETTTTTTDEDDFPSQPFDFLFLLEIFTKYQETPNFNKEILSMLNLFNLKTVIIEPSPYYEEKYLAVIKESFDQYKTDNSYIKFLISFFFIYPNKFDIFFEMYDGEENRKKELAIRYGCSFLDKVKNINVSVIIKLCSYTNNEQTMKKFISYPRKTKDILTLLTSLNVREKIKQFLIKPNPQRQRDTLQLMNNAFIKDEVFEILELYDMIKTDKVLNTYFNIEFDYDKLYSAFPKMDLNSFIKLWVYYNKTSQTTLSKNIGVRINSILLPLIKNEREITIPIETFLDYLSQDKETFNRLKKIKVITLEHIKKFIKSLFKIAVSFENLIDFFKIIPKDQLIKDNIIKELKLKFIEIALNTQANYDDITKYDSYIKLFITKLKENNSNIDEEMIKGINNEQQIDKLVTVLFSILKVTKEIDGIDKKGILKVIEILIEKVDNNNIVDTIIKYHDYIREKEIKEFFNMLHKLYEFKEENFLDEKFGTNFLLVEAFVKKNAFAVKSAYDSNYCYGLKNKIKAFLTILNDGKFDLNKLTQLNSVKESLERRFTILFFDSKNKEKDIKNLHSKITTHIDNILKYKSYIDTCLQYYHFYESSEKDKIKQLEKLKDNIRTQTIHSILNNKTEFEKLQKTYEMCNKYNRYLISSFFKVLFRYYNEQDEAQPKNIAESNIITFKNIFENNNYKSSPFGLDKIPSKVFSILQEQVWKLDEIKNEIIKLSELFNANIKEKNEQTEDDDNNVSRYNRSMTIHSYLNVSKRKATVEDTLFVILNTVEICKNLNGRMNVIKSFSKQTGTVYDKCKSLLQSITSKKYINNISSFIQSIQLLELNNSERSNYRSILQSVRDINDLFPFFKAKTLSSVNVMYEQVDESKDETEKTSLTQKELDDVRDVLNFILSFTNEINEEQSDEDYILSRFAESCREQSEQFAIQFDGVCRNFSTIQDLFSAALDKNELAKEIIKRVLDNGIVTITLNTNGIDTNVEYVTENNIKKNIKLEDLKEKRDRANLKKKQKIDITTIDPNKQDEKQKIIETNKFIERSSEFSNIVNKLSSLYDSLYDFITKSVPYSCEYTYTFKTNKLTTTNETITNAKDTDFEVEINTLNKHIENYQNDTMCSFQQSFALTFLYGRHMNHIIDYQSNPNDVNKTKIMQRYVKYLTCGKVTNIPQSDARNTKLGSISNKIFTKVDSFLNALYTNDASTSALLKTNSFTSSGLNPGFYTVLVEEPKMDIEIVELYMHFTGNLPTHHVVLQCSKETTSEELNAFFFRMLYCKENTLFTIFRIEQLPTDSQQTLITLYGGLAGLDEQKKKQIKASFVVVYCNKADPAVQQIERNKLNKILKYNKKQTLRDNVKVFNDLFKVKCISSDYCGIGKTYYSEHEGKGKIYKYFPIGGKFSKKDILDRLIEVPFDNDKLYIHFDLSLTENRKLFEELLFEIFILRAIKTNDDVCYINKNIEMIIELPNGFFKYEDKFQIFKLFTKHEIHKANLPQLDLHTDLGDDIQTVCNYLKEYKNGNIDKYDLKRQIDNDDDQSITKLIQNLPLNECEALIYEYMNLGNTKPSYYQIRIFIKILADQFNRIEEDVYLKISYFRDSGVKVIRSSIVKNIIALTEIFIKGAYDTIINQQHKTQQFYIHKDNDEELAKEADSLSAPAPGITFDNIKSSLVFINEDNGSLSMITNPNLDKNSNEYKELYSLFNSAPGKKTDLLRYDKLSKTEFLGELKKVLNLKIPVLKADGMKSKYKTSLEDITGNYVFTSDNFVKMIFILLNTRANIPVIMMGETGCGKTSLIQIISRLKCIKNRMKKLDIHAGITDKDIIEFIETNEFTNPNTKKYDLKEQQWVFFDEVNTCNSMGLLSEIMTKHTMLGKPINKNIVFIGACNPYRKVTENLKQKEEIGLVKQKEQKVRSLVYAVNPLPYSLLHFIMNFGALKREDEDSYIKNMIHDLMLKKMNGSTHIIDQTQKTISALQQRIKEINGISAVSLRDVNRFTLLFKWFYDYIENKKKMKEVYNKIKYEDFTPEVIGRYSVFLSLYLCYIVRLSQKEDRKQLASIIDGMFKIQNEKDINSFTNTVQREKMYIIDQIDVPQGIAKNAALLENMFTLFVCVINRIPVFICGKPGCSKSLSVQFLCKAMNGQNSQNSFFARYPRLIVTSFQGSATSTSESVLQLFDKATKVLTNRTQGDANKAVTDVISMIFFDEMGLAEISPHNPLKVIHSKLEYDERAINKVAFVGISNWKLDASKMNRGIFLSLPEPDEEDLIETAVIIANTYKDLGNTKKEIFEALAKTYFKYKDDRKKGSSSFLQDYHGSRDFYHLIKQAARTLQHANLSDDREVLNLITDSLERNFGGWEDSITKVKEIFIKQMPGINKCPDYNVIKCIKRSLQDSESRYPLIISKSSLSPVLITNILQEIKKDYHFFSGSQFEDDEKGESYSAKILNTIQGCMAENCALILQDMESIYPSLYDLFNQNFTEISGKKYARITLGYASNILCEVNKDFKCIVLVNQSDIEKEEAPFLNRFEKHIISFENMIQEIQKNNDNFTKISKTIKQDLTNLFKTPGIQPEINIANQNINIDEGEIEGLIYDSIKKERDIEIQTIKDFILTQISKTCTQDVLGYISKTLYHKTKQAEAKTLLRKYKNEHVSNFKQFIEKTNKKKLIIYTFSSITETILTDDINTENIMISPFELQTINISHYRTEEKFLKEITLFYSDKHKKMLIIHFYPCDCKHLNHLRNVISNYEREITIEKKYFVFIIHMSRFLKSYKKTPEEIQRDTLHNKYLISHLADEFDQVTIDDLNGDNKIDISELQTRKNSDMLKIINTDEHIKHLISHSFTYIEHKFQNKHNAINEERTFVENLINRITSDKDMINQIKTYIMKSIDNMNVVPKYWDSFLNTLNVYIDTTSVSLVSVFQTFIISKLEESVVKVMVALQNNSVFSSLYLSDFDKEINRDVVDIFLKGMEYGLLTGKLRVSENKIDYVYGYNICCISKMFKDILVEVNKEKVEYMEMEDQLRDLYEDDKDFEETLNNIKQTKQLKLDNVKQSISQNQIFSKLQEKNVFSNSDLFNKLLNDYCKFFLTSNNIKNIDLTNLEQFLLLLFNDLSHEDENVDKFADILLISTTYQNIIISMCNVFKDFVEYIPNLASRISTEIEQQNFEPEETKRNPVHKIEINKPFYKVFESLLYIITDEYTKENKMSEDKLSNYSSLLNASLPVFNNIDLSLLLFSKETNILNSFMNNFKLLSLCQKANVQNIKQVMTYEREAQRCNDTSKLVQNLEQQINFLITNCKTAQDFPIIIIDILLTKYSQHSNDKLREKIFEIILSDNNFIINSNPLLKLIFNDIEPLLDNDIKQEITREEALDKFLSFANTNQNPKHIIFTKFQQTNNIILDDVLLFFFEMNIYMKLYNNRTDENNCYMGLSLEYLSKAVTNVNNYHKSTLQNQYAFPKLAFLYSVAYIKTYLCVVSNYIIRNRGNVQMDVNRISEILTNSDKVASTLNIFYLKCLKRNFNSYNEFSNQKWNDLRLPWVNAYITKQDVPHEFNISLMDIKNMGAYFELDNKLKLILASKTFNQVEPIVNAIRSSSILNFYDVNTNKILSSIRNKEVQDSEMYKNLSSLSENLFGALVNNGMINSDVKNVLDLFFNRNVFLNKIFPIVKTMKTSAFEKFIYYFKFALIGGCAKKGSYYEKLFTNEITNLVNNCYNPGQAPLLNVKISSYYQIKYIIENVDRSEGIGADYPNSPGLYVCDCGYFYQLQNCSLPSVISNCPNCNKQIGGTRHKLVDRDGHVRIFKDDAEKKEVLGRGYCHLDNRYRMFVDYNREMQAIINAEPKGIHKIKFGFFTESGPVRSMDSITYRLLNLLLYSCFYFSNIVGILPNQNLSQYVCDGITCLKMLDSSFKELESELKKKEIKQPIIFLNMAMPVIYDVIKNNSTTFETSDKRNAFEQKVSQEIQRLISTFNNNLVNYQAESNKILGIGKESNEALVGEMHLPSEYDSNQYPFLKYFMFTEYPNEDILAEKNNAINDAIHKYPILSQYFLLGDNVRNLKHLLLTQSFSSKLIHYYSYKISREEARKKFIKEEIESMDNNEELLNEFERFLPLYNDLQHKGMQFKCRPPMKARQLSEESELAYFLNDDGQLDYGMHIAAINQKFIDWQNEFLNRISENLIPSHPLYFMKEGLSRRTTLNNATSSEIIELDRVGETVFDFISMYSRRDCYKDNTIDYQEYANSSMNYELIDTQLGKSILPNKKLFEDKQIFVVFKFEAYRSTGSSIIVDYFNKYPQEQLTRQMENDLREFKEREQAISDKVMFTLQQLIGFFMKQHLKKDSSINEAIEKAPRYFNLEKKITEFFEQHEEYKLHHLIEVYEYFEKLCENEIFQHLDPSVNEDLDDKTVGEFKNKIKNFRNFGIDKNLVREAIRKYISRMFGGKREELDFNPEEKVFFLLSRPELWPKEIRDEMEDTYQALIWGLDTQFHLKFKNIVHFYNLLGEE